MDRGTHTRSHTEELGEEDRPPQADRRTGEVPGTETIPKLNIQLHLTIQTNSETHQPTYLNKNTMNKRMQQDLRTLKPSKNQSNSSALLNYNKPKTKSLSATIPQNPQPSSQKNSSPKHSIIIPPSPYDSSLFTRLATTDGMQRNCDAESGGPQAPVGREQEGAPVQKFRLPPQFLMSLLTARQLMLPHHLG